MKIPFIFLQKENKMNEEYIASVEDKFAAYSKAIESRMQAVEDKVAALVELQKISDGQLSQLSAMLIHPGAR
jgi:hypothetical protein